MKTTLFRPVNLDELMLIQQSGWKAFPPRLVHQPIFYPVTNVEYARQITVEWNLPTYYNGFVTAFDLSNQYLKQFKIEKVGLDMHTELWVPAEQLDEFNAELIDGISVIEGYSKIPSTFYFHLNAILEMDEDKVLLQGQMLNPNYKLNVNDLFLINGCPMMPFHFVNKVDGGNPSSNFVNFLLINGSDHKHFAENRVYELKLQV